MKLLNSLNSLFIDMRCKTLIWIVVLLVFITGCKKKNALVLRETFSGNDPHPFGAMVAKQMMTDYYSKHYINIANESIAENVLLQTDDHALYFCVSKNLYLSKDDINAIHESVISGNTFFFSADHVDPVLLRYIQCTVTDAEENIPVEELQMKETGVSLISALTIPGDSSYRYFYYPFTRHFSQMNKSGRVIGYNHNGDPDCLVMYMGKGRLYIHTNPRVFSNYFLLTDNNYRYFESLLRIFGDNPQHIYWDNHYQHSINRSSSNPERKNSLSELIKYPPLAWAFFTLLGLFAIYVIVNGKRRQKVIRVIPPNTNNSVAFAETIARLYMQDGDHKTIALKMAHHFQEFIRTNYYLNSNMSRDEMINVLSRKSGVSVEHTRSLLMAIDKLTQAREVTSNELFRFHNQIQEFYKR